VTDDSGRLAPRLPHAPQRDGKQAEIQKLRQEEHEHDKVNFEARQTHQRDEGREYPDPHIREPEPKAGRDQDGKDACQTQREPVRMKQASPEPGLDLELKPDDPEETERSEKRQGQVLSKSTERITSARPPGQDRSHHPNHQRNTEQQPRYTP